MHRAFNNISDAELVTDLAQVTLDAALVLTRAGVTNDFQVRDLGKIGKNLILHSVGEVGVLFVVAYCYAARANDLLYFFDLDPTRARILLAETAVNAALRLRPDSAEAHFAMGDFLFRCQRDYDRALE